MTVTWQDVASIVEARGGVRAWRHNGTRGWYVPSPTGGTFSVEVTLGRRWSSIAVDRWRTTDRDESKSGAWFKEHIWPAVHEALTARNRPGDASTLPSGHTFASASTLEREALPELLAAWLDAELTWGIPADAQWPRNAPHRVTPGPAGDYG